MKVILIKDVARLGRKSEVKEVPSGHALNFLIPRKLAIIATPEGMKRLNEEVRQQGAHKEGELEAFKATCALLNEKAIEYPVQANDKGSLFKGIHVDDIVRHLASLGITLLKQDVVLEHPIKEVGVHKIPLRHGGTEGVCTLAVVKK